MILYREQKKYEEYAYVLDYLLTRPTRGAENTPHFSGRDTDGG